MPTRTQFCSHCTCELGLLFHYGLSRLSLFPKMDRSRCCPLVLYFRSQSKGTIWKVKTRNRTIAKRQPIIVSEPTGSPWSPCFCGLHQVRLFDFAQNLSIRCGMKGGKPLRSWGVATRCWHLSFSQIHHSLQYLFPGAASRSTSSQMRSHRLLSRC